jgi:hypothetical protein
MSTIRARGWPETPPPAEDIYEKEPLLRELDRGGIRAHSLADVIDGDWCRGDGKRMKIRGPEIVTPGGNRVDP